MPFRVETDFNQSPLAPFFALVPQLRGITIAGTGTGSVKFGGNLPGVTIQGNPVYSADACRLGAVQPAGALNPGHAACRDATSRGPFQSYARSRSNRRFAGGGSNVSITGTKAITDEGINNLSIDGRVNLSLLNAFPQSLRRTHSSAACQRRGPLLAGVNRTARVSGTATLENASVAAFIGSRSSRPSDRTHIFPLIRPQIDMRGYLGGGEIYRDRRRVVW